MSTIHELVKARADSRGATDRVVREIVAELTSDQREQLLQGAVTDLLDRARRDSQREYEAHARLKPLGPAAGASDRI